MQKIENYKPEKLTELKIKNIEDLHTAKTSMRAQINKWFDEQYDTLINIKGILLNKLIYYIQKEVEKTNKDFVINSGWYIYGPCYEEGRTYESKNQTIPHFKLLADEVSDEVKSVCDELVPLYLDLDRKGLAFTDFLRYIYTKKCDQEEYQDFYLAKHEIMCFLHKFSDTEYCNISVANPKQIQNIERQYEKIFYNSPYNKLISLKPEEIEEIQQFLNYMNEYINFSLEEQKKDSLVCRIEDIHKNTVLAGLSHINYSKTFNSFNKKYKEDTQKTHNGKGHEYLSRLKEDNRWLSKELFKFIYSGDSLT